MAGLPLLERERELARVSELVEGAASGEFGFALVEGPAGAGKSAILGALAASAGGRGLSVLRAVGLDLDRDYPFGVVRQLFEPAVQGLDEAARSSVFAGAAALAEPLLAGRGVESGRLLDPGFGLLHSLYWVLVGLTDLAPLAVVVDDIQWADPPSLRFLAFVIKRAEELPLLVAVARRDTPGAEQGNPMSATLGSPRTVIRPAPLSRQAVGSLLASTLGRKLDAETVTEAERLTEGNPLYVRELGDALRSAGEAGGEDPHATLTTAAPAAVGRRVRGTLARLGGPAQRLATAAAVLGEAVPLRHAAALARVESEQAPAAADALARADVLLTGEPLRFRHPLVREAVLESIGAHERAAIHGRAARLLIAEGEPLQRAAVHLLDSDPAGDPETVVVLRSAARLAVDEAAPELAIDALRRALREPPDRDSRPLVLNELALTEAKVGSPDASTHFEEAFASPAALEDMTDGAIRYAMLLVAQGKPAAAEALIDRVLSAISDRERRLMAEAELCTLATINELPGARDRIRRAVGGLRGETPAERLLLGLDAIDATNATGMTSAEAAPRILRALGNGSLLKELGPDSPTYLMLAGALPWLEEIDAAEKELAAAVTEATRRGAAFGRAVTSSMLAMQAWKRGDLRRAETGARTGIEIATQMGWIAGFPYPLEVLVDVLNDEGEAREADRLLRENSLNGPLPKSHIHTDLLGARGRLRLSQGRLEEGIQDLEEQRVRLDEVGDSPANLLALNAKSVVQALVQAGRRDEACQIADQALRRSRAFGQPRYIADSLRACALAASGGPDPAQLQEAAAIYEHLGARLDLARTQLDIGSAMRRSRKSAAARVPLRVALDLARACGAHPLAGRAEHELRASGARPRRDRITGRDALTATEQRVAQLAIEGMTNRQIAETLFVTRKTVKSHLEHIFAKLDIHARGELERALAGEDELTPVG